MAQTTDVVIAGSKPFALALFAPLAERSGTRPRIAVDPGQALGMCGASGGLLVVEFDARWLPVVQQLRQQAPALRIVAALPRGQESAALSLAPIGVEAAPWDGKPGSIMAGVERLLGASRPVAPAAVTAPVARPAARAPAAMPAPAPAALRPPTAPATARPATPAVPRPSQGAPPAPPLAPPRAAAAPAVAPAGDPADESAGVGALFDDLEQEPASAPRPASSPPAAAPPQAAGAPAASISSRVAPQPYVHSAPVPVAAPSAWPQGTPDFDEAEGALVLAARGRLGPDAPLGAAAERTLASLSALERAVVEGAAQPFDERPILRAAVLRLRVAAAIAAAPAAPARVDTEAVARLLAELDGALTDVNALATAIPAEHQRSLAALRNALVREAVDFSEVAHRLGSGEVPIEAPSHRPAKAPAARVLAVQAGAEATEGRRGGWAMWVLLALAVVAAAGVHGYRYVQKQQALARQATLPGLPSGMSYHPGVAGASSVAVPGGAPVDPAQVERFKAEQAKQGNTVIEAGGGTLVITRGPPPGAGGKSP